MEEKSNSATSRKHTVLAAMAGLCGLLTGHGQGSGVGGAGYRPSQDTIQTWAVRRK